MLPTIKPLRDYSEHDVLNIFAAENPVPMTKGTFVRITSGWNADLETPAFHGAVGASYGNTVSELYGVRPRMTVWTSGYQPLGMTLYDTRNTDENGELLKFNPKKAKEMCVVISGQAVPILTRGTVLYSGVTGSPVAGTAAYLNDTSVDGTLSPSGLTRVGTFLGTKDSNGYVLLNFDVAYATRSAQVIA